MGLRMGFCHNGSFARLDIWIYPSDTRGLRRKGMALYVFIRVYRVNISLHPLQTDPFVLAKCVQDQPIQPVMCANNAE